MNAEGQQKQYRPQGRRRKPERPIAFQVHRSQTGPKGPEKDLILTKSERLKKQRRIMYMEPVKQPTIWRQPAPDASRKAHLMRNKLTLLQPVLKIGKYLCPKTLSKLQATFSLPQKAEYMQEQPLKDPP